MLNKLYEKIKNFIIKNKIFIIIMISTILISTIEFPYYIESPGGIIDISDKIDISTNYKNTGSLNLAYVTEYKATIPTLIAAKFNKDWVINKSDTSDNNNTDENMYLRNHIMLDEANFNATKVALDKANITCNKNAIPNDPQKPGITSGVRIGTPAVTTRGLNEADMDVIAECMALIAADPEGNNEAVKAKVKALTDKYPLYA